MAHELEPQGGRVQLCERYHAMSDEELLRLSASPDDLTDIAREVLGHELNIRRSQTAASIVVPVRSLKLKPPNSAQIAGASAILDEFAHLVQVAAQMEPSPTTTVAHLIDLRTQLLDVRNRLLDFYENTREIVRGLADIDRLIGSIDETILNSLTPEVQEQWLKATAISKDLRDTYGNPSSPYYHAIRGNTPSALTEGIGGTSPEAVREMRKRVGEEGLGIVRRGVAEKLLGRTENGEYDLANFGRRLESMPEEDREALFGKEGHEQLRKIAADYKNSKDNYDDPTSIFYHAATIDNPSTLPGEFADWLIASPTPERVRELRARLGDESMGVIQRAVMEKLLGQTVIGEHDYQGFPGRLENLSEDFRNELFGSQQQALRDLASTARVLNTNHDRPSSGNGMQKRVEIGIAFGALVAATLEAWKGRPWVAAITIAVPLLYFAGQYGLAKLMTSPRFVSWLMTPKSDK